MSNSTTVLETRSYNKRKGSAKNPFTTEEKQAIRDSVREVGILQTVNDFKTLYIYVKAICDEKRMKIALGRRPSDSDKPVKVAKSVKTSKIKPVEVSTDEVEESSQAIQSNDIAKMKATVKGKKNAVVNSSPTNDVVVVPTLDEIDDASIDQIMAIESGSETNDSFDGETQSFSQNEISELAEMLNIR